MVRRVCALVVLIESSALATPRALPFTYPYATQPKGEVELEQYVDLVPAKVVSLEDGNPTYVLLPQLQTELEWGVTNHIEVAAYATFAPGSSVGVTPAGPLTVRNGAKQRIRFRLFDEGTLPIDTGFYFEISENTAEIELETKLILEKRFGRLHIATNLWLEREFYFSGRQEWVLNPTLGSHYEIVPWLHLGAEGFLRVEFPDNLRVPRPFGIGPHVYVGPTFLLSFGRFWWSTGTYIRASDFDRSPNPGDSFGPVWIRTSIGVGL